MGRPPPSPPHSPGGGVPSAGGAETRLGSVAQPQAHPCSSLSLLSSNLSQVLFLALPSKYIQNPITFHHCATWCESEPLVLMATASSSICLLPPLPLWSSHKAAGRESLSTVRLDHPLSKPSNGPYVPQSNRQNAASAYKAPPPALPLPLSSLRPGCLPLFPLVALLRLFWLPGTSVPQDLCTYCFPSAWNVLTSDIGMVHPPPSVKTVHMLSSQPGLP